MSILENREFYFIAFFFGVWLLSWILSRAVLKWASFFGILDIPDSARKIHDKPLPKLGGFGIFLSFSIGIAALYALGGAAEVTSAKLLGLFFGGFILIVGGVLDDKFDLKPRQQIIFPIMAAAAAILGGMHISYITNPFGGSIILDQYKIGAYPVFGSLLVFFWILGLSYATKFLDGLDGLVTGVSAIAGFIIFALSLLPALSQTTTAFLALIFSAAALGFLPLNFNPAKIFLGEGGSTFAGFMIASLAVVSGGKIATALLVLGIAVLDAAWVIGERLLRRHSPFRGDQKHLHFRLLRLGLSQRQVVLTFYLLAVLFGAAAVFLQSLGKLLVLAILAVATFAAAGVVLIISSRNRELGAKD